MITMIDISRPITCFVQRRRDVATDLELGHLDHVLK
jgi:hypothetical protein